MSPGKWPRSPVEIIIFGCLREFSTVLRFDMLNVGGMFGFYPAHPDGAYDSYTVNKGHISTINYNLLAGTQT